MKQLQEIQRLNQKINYTQQKILKIFIAQEKNLSNHLVILLKLYRRLCIKQKKQQKNKKNKTKQNKKKPTRLKILLPKQMLQRLTIALAQVKSGKLSKVHGFTT